MAEESKSKIIGEATKDILVSVDNNKIFASTDGYGICMGVALEAFLQSHGKQTSLSINYPENSPRYFWTEQNATILTTDPEQFDQVFVIGIPYNNWSPDLLEESEQNKNQILARISEKHENASLSIGALRHLRPEKNTETNTSPDDKTLELEMLLSQESEDEDVNLVTLARFAIKDPSLLQEIVDPDKFEHYETIALGVEVASRASLEWHHDNEDFPDRDEYLEAQQKESQKRLQHAIQRLKEKDWKYFESEAQKFRDQLELPTITLTPHEQNENPVIAFFDLNDLPIGLQALAVEESLRQTKAQFAVTVRYEPLVAKEKDYSLKVIKNWKYQDTQDLDLGKFALQGSRLTGSRRINTLVNTNPEMLTQVTKQVLLQLDPELNTVFEGTNTIAVVGFPNTGKSTVAEIIERYINILSGKEVARRIQEIDRAGITPDSYLNAIIHLAKLEDRLKKGKSVSLEVLEAAKSHLDQEVKIRQASKIPDWSETDIQEVRKLLDSLPDDQINLIDMPGGLPTRNEDGQIISVDINVPQIDHFLLSPKINGVLILGKNEDEIASWHNKLEIINQKRSTLGFDQIKIIGDAITYPDDHMGIGYADRPALSDPNPLGRIVKVSRTKIHNPNSTLLMMAVMISSLGLQKSRQYA